MLEAIDGRPPFPRIAPPYRHGVHYQAGMRTAFTVTPSTTQPAVEPVSLKDFAVDLASGSTPAGLTDFVVTNNGQTAHEFLIFRTDLDPGHLPLGADGRVDEEADGLTKVLDSGDNIEVGTTKTFNGALTAGQYVLVCNLPDHYTKGMYRPFTVG
jgi:uncharacterized cupredoxin-like copper-binding protein